MTHPQLMAAEAQALAIFESHARGCSTCATAGNAPRFFAALCEIGRRMVSRHADLGQQHWDAFEKRAGGICAECHPEPSDA